MESLYEKACKGTYLEKRNKNGDLLRTAEQFNSGMWIITEYPSSRTNIQGYYSDKEFKTINKRLFKAG